MPNFTALDMSLPEVATLVAVMVQARDAVSRRSWSHPQELTGEEWWADVLADPRARKRQRRTDLAVKQAFYRLADERREIILVACSKCDWRAAFSRDELIASHGPDCAMPNLLDHLAAPSCSRLGSNWIGAGCTTSSRSRARCSSFDGTPGGATTGTTLGQFRLDDAPALLEGFHLFFRRGDDLLRERCEQRLKSLVSIDRKHPVVRPVAPPGRRRVKTACARLARYDHFAA